MHTKQPAHYCDGLDGESRPFPDRDRPLPLFSIFDRHALSLQWIPRWFYTCATRPNIRPAIKKRINKKTKLLALISALSASGDHTWVEKRGHLIDKIPELPLVVDDKIQTIKKTEQIYSILCKFGLEDALEKHLAVYFDKFESAGRLIAVSPKIPATPLSDYKGSLKFDDFSRFFRQVISTQLFLKEKGIYHRDLKPENILLDINFQIKI